MLTSVDTCGEYHAVQDTGLLDHLMTSRDILYSLPPVVARIEQSADHESHPNHIAY